MSLRIVLIAIAVILCVAISRIDGLKISILEVDYVQHADTVNAQEQETLPTEIEWQQLPQTGNALCYYADESCIPCKVFARKVLEEIELVEWLYANDFACAKVDEQFAIKQGAKSQPCIMIRLNGRWSVYHADTLPDTGRGMVLLLEGLTKG